MHEPPLIRAVRDRLRPEVLRRAGLAVAALALAWIGSGALAALALTRRWTAPTPEPTPADLAQVRLRTADGLEIGAFLGDVPAPRAALVLVHGNGSDRSHLVEAARDLREGGHLVLPITVRAHGDSEGQRNDFGLGARHDVEAAVAFLEAHLAVRGQEHTPIVVVGVSLGAAAALFAAPSLGERVAGYVLVGPYADLQRATSRRTERYLPPVLDQLAYGALLVGGRIALPELDEIAPARAATLMPPALPVLVIVGERDARAPLSDAQEIVSPLTDAEIVVLPGLDHEAVSACLVTREGRALVTDFVAGLARPPRTSR